MLDKDKKHNRKANEKFKKKRKNLNDFGPTKPKILLRKRSQSTKHQKNVSYYTVDLSNPSQRFLIPNSNVDISGVSVTIQNSSSDSTVTTWTDGNALDITTITSTNKVYFIQKVYECFKGVGTEGLNLSEFKLYFFSIFIGIYFNIFIFYFFMIQNIIYRFILAMYLHLEWPHTC